jgi:hypothetical protein
VEDTRVQAVVIVLKVKVNVQVSLCSDLIETIARSGTSDEGKK